jgi:hypothetical protein
MKRSSFTILIILYLSISTQAKYSGGSGISQDPYIISNANDLLEMAANTDDYEANFILTADIDLGFKTFTEAVIAPDTVNSNTFEGINLQVFLTAWDIKLITWQ